MQQVSGATHSFIKEGLNRDRLRLSVIAHLAVELLLDRQIVLSPENFCADYYAAIELADEKLLGTYFDYYKLEYEKRIFLTNFLFFRERKFLFMFKDLQSIVFGLDRIYGKATGTVFTEEEKRKFLSALNNIDAGLRYSWKEILKP